MSLQAPSPDYQPEHRSSTRPNFPSREPLKTASARETPSSQKRDAGNEDRLFGEHLDILEAEGFNVEPAGALLLGLDASQCISDSTRERLAEILTSDRQKTQLTNRMIASSRGLDRDTAPQYELLVRKLRQGFLGLKD